MRKDEEVDDEGGQSLAGDAGARVRRWIRSHPFHAVAAAVFIGCLIGGGIAGSVAVSTASDLDQTEAELASTEAALEESQAAHSEAEAVVEEVLSRRDAIVEKARGKAERLVEDAKGVVKDQEAKLRKTSKEVSAAEAKLSDVEGSLASAQETKQKSSFGDGIWQAGTDFLPGLYRAPGGRFCYWAKLGSGDTGDIEDNGLGRNPTIQIDSPFFETDGCGTWQKIG